MPRPDSESKLHRTLFTQSRDREYFDRAELATMTGQPAQRFPDVIVKELGDNGLDAAEAARVVPELILQVCFRKRDLVLCIKDNGKGISPEAIERIKDFRTRTSDKAAYRSPTRGLQGNAMKTVIGIPYALGSRQPLIIEAQGKRHIIRPHIDPAGEATVDHKTRDVPDRGGTTWKVCLPLRDCHSLDLRRWMRGFALFNPHAVVKYRDVRKKGEQAKSPRARTAKFYKPTVRFPEEWTKFLPTDLIPINWYDEAALARLIFNHIGQTRKGGEDLTLRVFVSQFPGFTSTQRVSRVCAALPDVKRLTDFEGKEKLVAVLLKAMRKEAATRPPRPEKMGLIGEEHFRRRFDQWFGIEQDGDGTPRFWYGKTCIEVGDIPYVFEAAVAQTIRPGQFFHGVNFSPTFSDPFGDTPLRTKDVYGWGVSGFLSSTHAFSRYEQFPFHSAAAVHLVSPALKPLDKGKTRFEFPHDLACAAASSLWEATRVLYREGEQRKKDAAKQARADQERKKQSSGKKIPLTEAVWEVMEEALDHATGGMKYRVSRHTLYYSVRPRVQKYNCRKELTPSYFEQNLLTRYIQEHPDVARWIYSEPRGTLYEPHTGRVVPLGTREVEEYQFPPFCFNKILFVEKQGLWPVLKDARLAERFDMAVIAGEGYASEACRLLLQLATGKYQIFVLHDADPWGYNIERTLREETKRMPGYEVEVIDLGLTLEDALRMKLQTEEFTRDRAIPQSLELTELEQEYFIGEQITSKSWKCRRVELNAFTSPELIAYIERRLRECLAVGKVIPSRDKIQEQAGLFFDAIVREVVRNELDEILSFDGICEHVVEALLGVVSFEKAQRWVGKGFMKNKARAWDGVLKERLRKRIEHENDRLREMLLAKLQEEIEANSELG